MDTTPVELDVLISRVHGSAPDDPLGQIEVASSTASDLEELADHLIGHFVDQARTRGYSWTQIGERIGVTKQAVRKRFAPPDISPAPEGQKTFDRYDEQARRAVVLSEENARTLGHAYIGTEHLLLALCDVGEGLAVEVIREVTGTRVDDVRSRAVERLDPGTKDDLPDRIPLTPRAKKVLELSGREALRLGHGRVGTEHILLGILTEGAGMAAQVLRDAGIGSENAREQVRRLRGQE